MAEDKDKPKDPDNVIVKPAKDKPDSVAVIVPTDHRDAKAALKEAGAKFEYPNKWVLPKADFEAAETKVRDAARQDIALGADARAAREQALKDAKPAKPAKDPLTPEELEARKQARGEKAHLDAKARDKDRIPVAVGAAKGGDELVTASGTRKVSHIGDTVFPVNERLIERFPDLNLTIGDQVVFANFESLDAEVKPEDEPRPTTA